MRTQADTPFIKAEQIVHSLANGQYFFEVLIWMGFGVFFSMIFWFLLKTIFGEKKCDAEVK